MGARTGSADLPLHGGRVPAWLAQRMARLGTVIVEALVLHEGPHGVLRRLAPPFWFQARTARRSHWLSEPVRSFVEEPHAAIEGQPQGSIVNLTDRRAAPSRSAQVELATRPDDVVRELRQIPHMQLPAHHDVRPTDVF